MVNNMELRPWPHISISADPHSGKPHLEWLPVEGATGYEIHRGTDPAGPFQKLWTQEKSDYSNSTAKPGCDYYYKVVALTESREESDVVFCSTYCATPSPQLVISQELGRATLLWSAAEGAEKYEVYSATAPEGPYSRIWAVEGTSYPIPRLGEQAIYYRVKALCSRTVAGDSPLSPVVSTTGESCMNTHTDASDGSDETFRASVPGDYKSYVRSVFLRYMQRHGAFSSNTTFPDYFQQELNIPDSYVYARQLLRQGLLQDTGEGAVTLTQAGWEAINENHIKFFEWSTPYVSYQEYSQQHTLFGETCSFEETMNYLLLKKIEEFVQKDDFLSVRDICADVAQLYQQLGKQETAVYYYLTALYYDISGLDYHKDIAAFLHGTLTRDAAERSFCGIPIQPQVINGIRALKGHYRKDMIPRIYEKSPLSMHICPPGLMQELVWDLQTGPYEYGRWKKKFFAAYQAMLADPAEDSQQNNDGAAL